ncbi:BQ5605_C039g11774 [Microbotryum silenes-dioicae]|uniref:glucan 1,3-beta-glucosidase n=1 Tax=Microbotryum silenes-dioicae TaxID=796604 RepID=A0A2X0PFP7_9BASI|nr:BQ5605_C039g11774 [Microbotryum silenes-dioicae]
MSYPPRRDQHTYYEDAYGATNPQRSSADVYAAVPTNHEAMMHHSYSTPYDDLASPSPRHDPLATPPIFQDDGQFPVRSQSSTSVGDHHDPYARYDTRTGSTYSLGGDGQSQRGLDPRSPSGMGVYDKYEDHEMSDKSKRRGASNVAGGRKLAKDGKVGFWGRLSGRGRKFLLLLALVILLIIIFAVAIPTAIIKHKNEKSDAASGSSGTTGKGTHTTSATAAKGIPTGASGSKDWKTAAYGGDGSIVYTEDGSSFTYNNSFGGFWVSIPFNDTAQAQDYVPPLNKEWDYSVDPIYGVNFGGWLTIEPFIAPSLFEPFNSPSNLPNATNNAIDEWHLSQALGSNLTSVITNHYETFITEKDFAEVAGAGLNWVRIPIPWWIIEVWDGEPFLANVGWTYFLKAIAWARKYGIRINLDLHAVPGSQNGYNHSGKQGSINFLNGVMGIANAQRTLDYIRTLTEFISQPQYKNVVPMFSVLNEPYGTTIGVDALRHFYYETYSMMRNITGFGTGNGPFITFHDAFFVLNTTDNGGWLGWMPGSDRVALDRHPYLCFATPNNDGLSYQAAKPCSYWASEMNQTAKDFGLAIAGEWSLAINDCGKWLNNVGNGNRYDGTYYIPNTDATTPQYASIGSCDPWNDYASWNSSIKQGLNLVATGHMSALRNWFFWTWKTGYSETLGKIANPMWNYQLGYRNGWIPRNPRDTRDACASLVKDNGFTVPMPNNPAPTLATWMTGGAGAGTQQNPALVSTYSQWPPTKLGAYTVANLPQYTPTASIITLPVSTPTTYPPGYSAVTTAGTGWFNSADTAGFMTEIPGCTYPNPWEGVSATAPTTPCTGAPNARAKRDVVDVASPLRTPPPVVPRRRT